MPAVRATLAMATLARREGANGGSVCSAQSGLRVLKRERVPDAVPDGPLEVNEG